MTFHAKCRCGARLKVPDTLRGKRGKCPTCHQEMTLSPLIPPLPIERICTSCSDAFFIASDSGQKLCQRCDSQRAAAALALSGPVSVLQLAPKTEPSAPAIPPIIVIPTSPPKPPTIVKPPPLVKASTRRHHSLSTKRLVPGVALLLLLTWVGFNSLRRSGVSSTNPVQFFANNALQAKLDRVIESDSRNAGIEVSVYYRDAFSNSVIVFDLLEIGGSNSRLDIFRVLLDFAEQTKDSSYEAIELAFRGRSRFRLSGSYFRTLGRERNEQNPAYVIRTFPENVKTLSGDRAYPEWTGGIIGVLGKQMEDFGDVHDKWYFNELTTLTD